MTQPDKHLHDPGATQPLRVSINTVIDTGHRSDVWIEVHIPNDQRVSPENARGLSDLLIDGAAAAETLRGTPATRNRHDPAALSGPPPPVANGAQDIPRPPSPPRSPSAPSGTGQSRP